MSKHDYVPLVQSMDCGDLTEVGGDEKGESSTHLSNESSKCVLLYRCMYVHGD